MSLIRITPERSLVGRDIVSYSVFIDGRNRGCIAKGRWGRNHWIAIFDDLELPRSPRYKSVLHAARWIVWKGEQTFLKRQRKKRQLTLVKNSNYSDGEDLSYLRSTIAWSQASGDYVVPKSVMDQLQWSEFECPVISTPAPFLHYRKKKK